MKKISLPVQIALDQLGPKVDVAGCWKFHEPASFRYHNLFHHFILVEQGTVFAKTPSGEFTAREGDLLCLRPASWSEYRTALDTVTYQMQVAFAPPPLERATPVLPGLGLLPVHTCLGARLEPVLRIFDMICRELPQAGLPGPLRWKAGLYNLLEQVVAAAIGEASPREADCWEKIRLRLTAVEGPVPSVAGFARELSISPRHFRAVFKRRFGVTPQRCRSVARLNEALRRLRSGSEPVKVIAHSLGFRDAKGLTRALRKHLGLTSSQLRRQGGRIPALNQLMLDAFIMNRHVLPPGKDIEEMIGRYAPQEARAKG